MGVSSTANRATYTGDGSTTSFAFSYYFFAQADLLVYLYDTVAGTVTLKTLGSDYTISGTTNLQGLYPSGANIVLGSAPASTIVIVITRAPIEENNYTLLQNATINTTALVQQFDYLTLLIQRLEDQVSRCVQIPDGLGATFSPILPANMALSSQEGAFFQINPAGNGLQLGPLSLFNTRAGEVAISDSSSSVSVTYSSAFTDTNYAFVFSIRNTADASPILLQGEVTAKSASAVTVSFNAPTDTSNYILDYIAVRNT